MSLSEVEPQNGLSKKLNTGFNLEEFIFKYRWPIGLLLFGAILVGLGVFLVKGELYPKNAKIEVLEETTESEGKGKELVVEIAGAVEKSGVYQLPIGSRIEDLLIVAGGVSGAADRGWMEKSLNRAARLSDGQKIYIPKIGESTTGIKGITSSTDGGGGTVDGLVNINTASQKELEALPGIGPVYAQNIIEHRPYSTVEDLRSQEVLKKSVYEKIKEKVTVY